MPQPYLMAFTSLDWFLSFTSGLPQDHQESLKAEPISFSALKTLLSQRKDLRGLAVNSMAESKATPLDEGSSFLVDRSAIS